MTDEFVEEFLKTFDDNRYPGGFLQQYELMECLSTNEMGETLLVKDRQTGKHYVSKCYSNQALQSPITEGSLLKQLHHKGLPAYIGEHKNEGMCCVVREFAPGKPLDELVQERPLAWRQSIAIVVQLCEILTYLHGQTPPIIHRDIKPQNIIVDEQFNITLIDFGISRKYNETAQEDTHYFGTRYYAAPEQYGFAQTDSRSDIYSLGVLLCWLLTGREDVRYAKKGIPNRWLENTVERCTAFAPKDRYKNAAQVRDALTGRTMRRSILSFVFAALIILAAIFFFANSPWVQTHKPAGVAFKEPLIEQAVRLALKKDPTAEISEQELLSITELYVFGDKAAADEKAFYAYADSFVNNGGTVQRGSITVLDDLTKIKNLRRVSLCYQNIVDVTALGKLTYLEYVDLHHNPIRDISPIAQLPALSSLIIFDTQVSDLTVLRRCSRLSKLDAGYTLIKSMAALEGLSSLQSLVLRKAPLQSLEGINSFPMLEQVFLSETRVLDLSPLLDLPRLQLVEVDGSMRKSAQAIAEKAQFDIIYQ